MNVLRRIFAGVHRPYLIRAYMIGFLFFALIGGMALNAKPANIGLIVTSALSTLLFPFAKLVWDELRNLVLGNNMIIMPILVLFPLKLFVNAFLWGAAILVAPLGILYLWFRTPAP